VLDEDDQSAKFQEYRDLRDGVSADVDRGTRKARVSPGVHRPQPRPEDQTFKLGGGSYDRFKYKLFFTRSRTTTRSAPARSSPGRHRGAGLRGGQPRQGHRHTADAERQHRHRRLEYLRLRGLAQAVRRRGRGLGAAPVLRQGRREAGGAHRHQPSAPTARLRDIIGNQGLARQRRRDARTDRLRDDHGDRRGRVPHQADVAEVTASPARSTTRTRS
jgi:hypothetical protein